MLLKKMIFFVLRRSKKIEVFLRCLFESNIKIKYVAQKIYKRRRLQKEIDINIGLEYKEKINSLEIKKGDILLVHSSMDGLAKLGLSPQELLDFLLDLVGETGTLVMPAYPKEVIDNNIYVYDVNKSIPSTGLLPFIFFKYYSNVERSSFPLNTLAAKGWEAKNIVQDNLKDVYSQGEYSSWKYCIERNMKILFLGVEACTCNTFIHYPEDILGESWPIKDFFIEKKFKIIQKNGEVIYKTIKERNPFWYRYFAMFYSGYWFSKNKYLYEYYINGVYLGLIKDTKKLAEEILTMAKNHEIFFAIPKKYWK